MMAVSLRSLASGVHEAVQGLLGLAPHYMPVFGAPGTVAAFTDPEWKKHLALFRSAGATRHLAE